MAKHKLYDESPKLEHDDKGKVHVKKSESSHPQDKEKGESASSGLDVHEGHAHERRAMHHKHLKEHMDMHTQHEMAHMHHKGDKKALHSAHEKEYGEMHARHQSEHKAMHTKHEKMGMTSSGSQATVDEPIDKVEKGAKA